MPISSVNRLTSAMARFTRQLVPTSRFSCERSRTRPTMELMSEKNVNVATAITVILS